MRYNIVREEIYYRARGGEWCFLFFSLTRILICAVICPCTNFCSLWGHTLTNKVILLFESIYLRTQMAVNAFSFFQRRRFSWAEWCTPLLVVLMSQKEISLHNHHRWKYAGGTCLPSPQILYSQLWPCETRWLAWSLWLPLRLYGIYRQVLNSCI